MFRTRAPSPILRPFVSRLWVTEPDEFRAPSLGAREHVLPTGSIHVAIRLSTGPLRIYRDADDTEGRYIGHAVVGGPRTEYYIRDMSEPSNSVGAMLRPGAAEVLLGISPAELAHRHVNLEDIWGRPARGAREQLLEMGDPEQRLVILESLLARRIRANGDLHPAVAFALEELKRRSSVDAVVRRSGYSHRHFISLFRRAVGLSPKTYSRILRFRRTLPMIIPCDAVSFVEVALEAGYSDQAHFSREFVEFAGVAPAAYRKITPAWRSHVPVAGR